MLKQNAADAPASGLTSPALQLVHSSERLQESVQSGHDPASPTSAEEGDSQKAVLSRLLPFHVTVAASLQRVSLSLLDEAHPGVADPAAAPASLRERQKHPSPSTGERNLGFTWSRL